MSHLHGKSLHKLIDNIVEKMDYPKVDFNPSEYTEEELKSISQSISDELYNIRVNNEKIKEIELKTKYEHQWIEDCGDLYYIIEIESSYKFKYLYFCKDVPRNLLYTNTNFEVGIGNGCGEFEDNFTNNFHILDADEAGARIVKFKEELNEFIEEVLV